MAAPYQVVQQVFDNAVATANNLANSSASQIAGIAGTLAGLTLPSQVSVPAISIPGIGTPGFTPVATPTYAIPTSSVIGDTYSADFTQKLVDTQTQIATQLSTFFSTYFPMTLNDTELTLAQGWVINVLSNGGAMNPTIENQYWQRDRDRIARETAVKVAETTANWASRGFALPPGAAVGAVLAAQRTGLEQLSQSSREVAIKKYETEVELQQKAIELAISLRTAAMSSMSDFIKTLVFTPREDAVSYAAASLQATKVANDALVAYFGATTTANISLIDAQTRVGISNASSALTAAQIGTDATKFIADLSLRSALGTTDIAVRQNETAGNWGLTIAGKRIDAALASASMTATMASAALNGIHATAGVSGASTDNTQFYG